MPKYIPDLAEQTRVEANCRCNRDLVNRCGYCQSRHSLRRMSVGLAKTVFESAVNPENKVKILRLLDQDLIQQLKEINAAW